MVLPGSNICNVSHIKRPKPGHVSQFRPFPCHCILHLAYSTMKSKEEIVAQFNEEVNMTAEELEAWLEDPKSEKAGTGVGVESGHKIVEILKKNPTKDPEKYDEVGGAPISALMS